MTTSSTPALYTRTEVAAVLRATADRFDQLTYDRVGLLDISHESRIITTRRHGRPAEYWLRLETLNHLEAWLRATRQPHRWLTTYTVLVGRQEVAAHMRACADAIETAQSGEAVPHG
ncbi:hypothetical protein [Nonomuraea typhae]|uniref:hypothetical protein n=1 Tax=Nonomuraea typhae TaxID=2603600 RepID=UPI0012FC37B2|nr:hypothetical protein [Nonomuraea typhae]